MCRLISIKDTATPDCGSLLRHRTGHDQSIAATISQLQNKLSHPHDYEHPLRTFSPAGWLRQAAAGCRSPG